MATQGFVRGALGSRWLPWSLAAVSTAAAATLAVLHYKPLVFKPRGFESAMELVRAGLKDPESARFSDLWTDPEGKYVCGDVNAKNSMGGYVGKRPFMLQLATGTVEFEPQEAGATASAGEQLTALSQRLKFLEDVRRLCGEPPAKK